MPDLSITEFVDKVCEIMPIMMKEFFKHQAEGLHKMKITLPQFVVLDILKRQGESKMSSLAHFINVTTAAMTGIVDRLVRGGYIKRTNDPEDRRVIRVFLTAKGDKLVEEVIRERKKLIGKIFGMISQKEREEYLEILKHIRDRLVEKGH